MTSFKRTLGILLSILGLFFLFLICCAMLIFGGMALGLMPLFLLMLIYGWMVYAYLEYRECRHVELAHLLCTAADSQAPLAPALRSYLADRPKGTLREFWTSLLLFFVAPGYYWVWHRKHSQDRKISQVASLLEMGQPLPTALEKTPGVVCREVILASQVGTATGTLAACLRSALPRRLAPLLLEMAPRFAYPLLLLTFLTGLASFWGVYLLPKMERIYADFGQDLPESTRRLATIERSANLYFGFVGLVILLGALLAALFLASSRVRWYFPILGRIYRRQMQSHVLRMLGVLLNAGLTLPRALSLLADSTYFSSAVRERLRACCLRLEGGEGLAPSMRQTGLLQPAMVPLLDAAQRVHNLPWAMTELGETLSERTVRSLSRLSQIVFPVLVMSTGAVVCFIVLGMFMPVIDLITRMAA